MIFDDIADFILIAIGIVFYSREIYNFYHIESHGKSTHINTSK